MRPEQSVRDVVGTSGIEVERQCRTVARVARVALGLNTIYLVLYVVLGLWFLAAYNTLFFCIYGALGWRVTPTRVRWMGAALALAGTIQVAGISLLVLPPDTGNHYFLLAAPIFSMIVIDSRDLRLLKWFAVPVVILIGGLEWVRDDFVPPFAGRLADADHSVFAAAAAMLTLGTSLAVFIVFYRGFLGARREVHASYERSAALLERVLVDEREQAERQLSFFSQISHELRTPLASIGAASEILNKHGARLSEAQRAGRLETIVTSVRDLRFLIDDALSVARARTYSLAGGVERVELCSLLRSQVETASLFGRPEIDWEVSVTPDEIWAMLDVKLWGHVVANLVSNAFKYAGDGAVSVSLSLRDELIVLEVSDSGIGMSDEDLDNLFTPFERGGNVGTIEGTGLGMVVVKQAVDQLGGEFAVQSELGVGSTMTVKIPREPGSPVAGSEANQRLSVAGGSPIP